MEPSRLQAPIEGAESVPQGVKHDLGVVAQPSAPCRRLTGYGADRGRVARGYGRAGPPIWVLLVKPFAEAWMMTGSQEQAEAVVHEAFLRVFLAAVHYLGNRSLTCAGPLSPRYATAGDATY